MTEQASKKISDKYEFILVGHNMASLQMAFELAGKGKSFCLVDCRHTGQNSLFKFIPELNKNIYTGLPFNTGLNQELSFFELEILGSHRIEARLPLTFAKGEFSCFSGFGDEKPEAISAVIPYCRGRELKIEETPENFFQNVSPLIEDHLFLDKQITDVQYSGKNIEKIILNGHQEVKGQFFYFFDQLTFLFEKLQKPLKRTFRQFQKIKWFSSVNLMIHHKKKPGNFELDHLYLLMGLRNQPCLGVFSDFQGELISSWQSFFSSQLVESPGSTASVFRELKKQIQRAFPVLKNEEFGEFISLQTPAFGDLGQSSLGNGKSEAFDNLFIYSPRLCTSVGWFHDRILGYRAFKERSDVSGDD